MEPQAGQAAQAVQETLWQREPALRTLTVAASLLTLAAVAVPALLPQTVQTPPAQLAAIAPVLSTPAVTLPSIPAPVRHAPVAVRTAHAPRPVAAPLPVGGLVLPSGVLERVNQHNRHGPVGQPDYPITITVVTPPTHGVVTTADATGMLPTRDGMMRNSQMKQVFYQSAAGFRGRDSFTYTRTSTDPRDPMNGNTYTMVIDVR